ncbi:hypothetical protein [Chromatocurvus halotolerans]|uniref:hypothetical protein n=1 Tax=Chromatocurvus halotolerans TaxID=1132028 RepID=UPI000E3E8A3A|nr:hypothetical protein [Chromatocurvus halotolerans]
MWPLTEFHDIVLHGESDWTIAERELLAAYNVFALFNCMNRIVEGCGVMTSDAHLGASRSRQQETRECAQPYLDFARGMGFSPSDSA